MNKYIKKGYAPWNKGKKLSKETRKKISFSKKKIFEERGYINTKETREKMKQNHKGMLGKNHTIEAKNKIGNAQRGKKNYSWKGGITPENVKIRLSIDGRIWRYSVYIRDNFSCQKCGKRGGNLNAHHIKSFSKYPELRFAIDNGITFCKLCHNKTHKKI